MGIEKSHGEILSWSKILEVWEETFFQGDLKLDFDQLLVLGESKLVSTIYCYSGLNQEKTNTMNYH